MNKTARQIIDDLKTSLEAISHIEEQQQTFLGQLAARVEALEAFQEALAFEVYDLQVTVSNMNLAVARWASARMPVSRNPEGYIYLARSGVTGLIKIGSARDPQQRIATFQTVDPSIELVATHWVTDMTALEYLLHRRYAGVRRVGEWFALNDGLVTEIAELMDGTRN